VRPTPLRSEPAGAVSPDSREVALVERARGGDRGAFGELYERFAPMVHAVLLGRIAAREARDLVQDVFVAALARLPQLEEPGRFGAWLAAIARNRANDALRATRPESSLDAEPGAGSAASAGAAASIPTEKAEDADEAARVLAALRELPEAYRETLAMRLVEGLSGRVIAARTGLTYGSVRVNLCRGMKLLRERLTDGKVG